jgi:Peptidase family M1 domain
MSRPRSVPLVVVLLLALSLIHAAPGAPEPAPAGGAATPEALAAAVASALNAREETALAGLVAGSRPAWMTPVVQERGTERAVVRHWEGVAGVLPGENGLDETVVVFSTYHPVESDDDHVHRLTQVDGQWRVGPELPQWEAARQFRILDHRLAVHLQPEAHTMQASDHMTVERLPGASRRLLCWMNADFQVRSVRAKGRSIPFQRLGGLLVVPLPDSAGAGRFTLDLEYDGTVHHPGWDDIDPACSYIFSYWYPHIARLPATAEVSISAPADLTVIGQGELKRRGHRGEEAVSVWRQDHPVCWIQFAAGRYHVTQRTVNGKTLGVYLLKEDNKKAEAALHDIEAGMRTYTHRFGPFPWSHYEVVECQFRAGALESYTFTGCGSRAIPGAVVHELAHSWWGGIVPNPYTSDMWNEAFATYSERLVREEQEGRDRGRRRRDASGRVFGRVPISQARDALDGAQSAVGYGKGAALLHLVRRTVGDDLFFRSLQTFVSTYRGRAATWRDYAAVVEQVTGRDMRPFFDQWLERPGVPRVGWGRVTTTAGPDGSQHLEVELRQARPTYQLDLPLAIETQDGKQTRRVLALRGETAALTVDLPAVPQRLRLDPDNDVPLAWDPSASEARGEPWTYEFPAPAPAPTPASTPAAAAVSLLGGVSGTDGWLGLFAGSRPTLPQAAP